MNMQTPSTICGGFNGSQAFPNWNWSMQAFQPPFMPAQANGTYGEFNYENTNISGSNNSGSTPGNMEVGGITLNGPNSLGSGHNNIEMNAQDALKFEQEMIMNANVASMAFNTPQQQHIYQQSTNISQHQASEQQALLNRQRLINALMFQNSNTDNMISTDSKISETLATNVFSEANKFNDANIMNQYNFKKERLCSRDLSHSLQCIPSHPAADPPVIFQTFKGTLPAILVSIDFQDLFVLKLGTRKRHLLDLSIFMKGYPEVVSSLTT